MFDYNKDLSNGTLCDLFIEHGGFVSDGVDLIRKDGYLYHAIRPENIPLEMRKMLTPNTRLDFSPYRLAVIVELIKQNPDIRIDAEIRNTGKVVFRNCIYNVSDGKTYRHDGKYNWAVVNADYRKDVTIKDAPAFLGFVNTSLDYQARPEKTDLLLEIIGYSLSDYTVAKKGFFFIGEPSSGKSKILEFLQKLIGDDSVSQIALPQISSRFSLGQLQGKRINVCTELPSNKFPSIDVFKALTSCDRVYGEMKGKDGFSYYPRVKLLNAGNSVPLPANTDGTSSVIDRMVFLLFKHKIPREKWNMKLVEDLLAERDVICSLAMQGLKRLAANKFEFTFPDDSKRFAEGYNNMLNAFKLFVEDVCKMEENSHAGSQQLWDCYVEFCNDNDFPRGITRQLFAQKLAALNGVKKQRVRENGKQITIFKGISIRSALDDAGLQMREKAKKSRDGTENPDTKIRKEPTTQADGDSSCTVAQGTRQADGDSSCIVARGTRQADGDFSCIVARGTRHMKGKFSVEPRRYGDAKKNNNKA